MPRRPEIGNIQLYPNRPLKEADRNGYVLKFYCPLLGKRVRKNCGTRDRKEARKIQRECRERLINGQYVESGGAITAGHQSPKRLTILPGSTGLDDQGKSWEECYQRYREQRKTRIRETSLIDAVSRLSIAERIFASYRKEHGLSEHIPVKDVLTLDMLEYLQDRLLAGDECRYDQRSPSTVNGMMKAVLAFARFCFVRKWIDEMPPIEKLDVDEVMKGRPITGEEFDRMLDACPKIVGQASAPSWQFALWVLWESSFRIADLLDFSWDDDRHVHPVWPTRGEDSPTIVIPSSQKNGRLQEIPMLPGLVTLLASIPESERTGWIVNPAPCQYEIKSRAEWYCPSEVDLRRTVNQYSNRAIAHACGVSDTAVRKWMRQSEIVRTVEFDAHAGRMPDDAIAALRQNAVRHTTHRGSRSSGRLTKERVSRVIAMIGEQAGIVVRPADPRTGQRQKFASAHDLRRGFAHRLINADVPAESLKVIMRHKDFATTEKHYGAIRSVQTIAKEVAAKLSKSQNPAICGGINGGTKQSPELSAEEIVRLKSLLNSL